MGTTSGTTSYGSLNLTDGQITLGATTLTEAEVGQLDSVTAGTVVANKAMVAGSNGVIQGHRNVVEAHTGNDTLLGTESFSIHTNEGAGGAVKLTLPAALVGMEFTFYVMAAQQLQIDPNGSETAAIAGIQQAAGKYVWADAVGEYVTMKCVKAGQWEDIGTRGTWTAEA